MAMNLKLCSYVFATWDHPVETPKTGGPCSEPEADRASMILQSIVVDLGPQLERQAVEGRGHSLIQKDGLVVRSFCNTEQEVR